MHRRRFKEKLVEQLHEQLLAKLNPDAFVAAAAAAAAEEEATSKAGKRMGTLTKVLKKLATSLELQVLKPHNDPAVVNS